jgi:hypothetical protein
VHSTVVGKTSAYEPFEAIASLMIFDFRNANTRKANPAARYETLTGCRLLNRDPDEEDQRLGLIAHGRIECLRTRSRLRRGGRVAQISPHAIECDAELRNRSVWCPAQRGEAA